MSETALLVCGFFDQATALAGLAWRTADGTGGLLGTQERVSEASAEISEPNGDDPLRLTLAAEQGSCEARLSPLTAEAPLTDGEGRPPGGEPASALCRARVELSLRGGKRSIDCTGHLTRWRADPLEGAELVRHLAIPAPDGGLLLLAARREPGADGHDAEESGAWLLDAEGQPSAFAEVLLSTQYDEGGRQTRAGLELWPGGDGEAPPMRAAGTLLGEATSADGFTAALLESSAEGTTGRGSYLIWRT